MKTSIFGVAPRCNWILICRVSPLNYSRCCPSGGAKSVYCDWKYFFYHHISDLLIWNYEYDIDLLLKKHRKRHFCRSDICFKQECIPVAFQSAAVAISGGRVCLPGGCLPGGYLPRGCLLGGCLPRGCLPRGCLPRGVFTQREMSAQRGVSAGGGVCQGVSTLGGVFQGGVCLGVFCLGVYQGVSVGRVGVCQGGCLPGGSLPRDVCLGGCLPREVCVCGW